MTTGAPPDGGIMTPTEMDEVAPPPPLISPHRSSWTSVFRSHERRWWTIALTATLLVSALGIGLLYADDTSNQAAVRSLQLKNESLTGRNQNLSDKLNTTQTNLTATLAELAKTKAQLEHPQLTIWNVSQTISSQDMYLAGGIPDTFTYHLQATSTGPMNVSILTLEQWATANACVQDRVGRTNYCMHHSGAVMSWLNVTSVNYDFHLAEGCADYISVFTAASTVTVAPNVSVTYNPADRATGACA